MSDGSRIPFYQVDAFTNQPFRGNPAAVCVLEEPLSPRAMQTIAAEMNLSETAFVQPRNPEGLRRLQWFTPTTEVPLCGHATLATSHVLLNELGAESTLRYDTLSGVLTITRSHQDWLRMDFPADPPREASAPPGLLEALNCPWDAPTLRSRKLWVVRLGTEGEVRELEPDISALGRVDLGEGPLGVSVTAPGDGEIDFVSRFFGPWVGVDEDPVTGMAHTILTPYWLEELDRSQLRARQVSERGGDLRVSMGGERVHVSGQAVTVARGELVVPGE